MARSVWRVSPLDEGWQVRRDGASRATAVVETKREAVETAREIAQSHAPSRVMIHRVDGTIQRHVDYGEEALSYAGVFEGPNDLGARSEKYLAEVFSEDGADP